MFADTLLPLILTFCRIGGTALVLPGLSHSRVPVRVRLYFALTLSVAIGPLLVGNAVQQIAGTDSSRLVLAIVTETLIGLTFGLLARAMFEALQFAAVAMSNFVGFSNLLGVPLDGAEPVAALSSLITMTATVLLFMTDLHLLYFEGLALSYQVMPMGGQPDVRAFLLDLVEKLSGSFLVALQLSSPFLVYSLLINLLFGIANRLIPQIPIYFVSLPFVLAGGFVLLYLAVGGMMEVFIDAARAFLGR